MDKNLDNKKTEPRTNCPKSLPDFLKNLPLKNLTDQELKQIQGGLPSPPFPDFDQNIK